MSSFRITHPDLRWTVPVLPLSLSRSELETSLWELLKTKEGEPKKVEPEEG